MEETLRELFFDYKYTIIVIGALILLILLIVLIAKVWDIANYNKDQHKEIDEIKDIMIVLERKNLEQTKLLEQIANALEQDSEPYVIEEKENS